ncbi:MULTISPECIES: sensor histidine kinase [unclassified Microbacterium]|uniref:sensor histidine kinase n=1 Tax=unclassified Microbacterium TaxID=2609290 RepID=UPI0021A67F1E|nr:MULTISPECIES: sensor histidine kinase [unclassified Microbacterium]MCT1364962.1 sensor histidine kinase [Microbacterium sp. p3-SID131]MCT1375854.1 sensor histidine kinase [Microbacterium sp. p3-SID337]MDH5134179.1 sensor histidine kinase [Microbacterium sp. RD10]MDH5137629.1 sensor histidine kinase [Microbacterium sp. RD11]MDH5143819.1 sensor histidine kinase [Microbacterium sp. RD12]
MAFTRTPTLRDQRGDLLLALVLFVGAILSAALSSIAQVYGDEQAPLWTALVYAVVVAAPLGFRRRWPGTVAVVVSLAYFTAVTIRVPEIYVGNIAMFIALYTVGAWMNDRRKALVVRVAIIVGMFVWLLITMYRDAISEADKADVVAGAMSPYVAFMLIQILLNALYFGGAYYFGERSWAAAEQRTVLEERTRELEREREVTAAQAVALDRVRIARELHDVVAHHVSVMGVQAGAARLVLESDPAQSARILSGIESSARDAIQELRQLLETLRTPGGDTTESASTVSLDDIAALAQASTEAGLPTAYTVIGDPVPVPSLVAVNLYRIAQESLTNARRHAGPGATADVRVRYDDDGVEVEVVNTGRAIAQLRPGLGQLGMRERAAASGGTVEVTPRVAGGLRVRARVPLGTAVPEGAR